MKRGRQMERVTWTHTCRLCQKKISCRQVGILTPLARPLSGIRAFCHLVHSHHQDLRLIHYVLMLKDLLKDVLRLAWGLVLITIRAVSYVFYPLYIVLSLLYDD